MKTIGRSIAVLAGAAFALWLGIFFLVPVFTRLLDAQSVASYGAVGDMFGAAGSLFAGLGAIGVFVVLLFDLRERRSDTIERKRDLRHREEELRPFVILNVVKAQISYAGWRNNQLTLVIEMDVKVENGGQTPALNLDMKSELSLDVFTKPAEITVPQVPIRGFSLPDDEDDTVANVQFTVTGEAATRMFDCFKTDAKLSVDLVASYTSLTKVVWISSVKYTLARLLRGDKEKIDDVADSTSGIVIGYEPGGEPNDETVDLKAIPVKGSWDQARDK